MDIQIIDFHIKYQGDDVILYGRNKENKLVKIVVTNYKPYFYIKYNDNIKNKKSNIKKIQTDKRKPIYKIEECNKYIFSEFNEYKKIDVYKIIVKLSNFKSFKSVDVNDKYEQLEIYYDYCKQFNTNVDLYDNNGNNNNNYNNTISTYVDVYENKIDPILKFYHNKNIKPCGWIDIPDDSKYNNKLNQYSVNYNNISNIDKNIKCNNLMYTIFKKLHTQFFSLNDNKIDIQNNNYFPSLWNHITSNNSSLYYSYIWNEIIASELYKKKIKKNNHYNFDDKFINFLINYNCIKPAENISEYLGNVPSIESFCKLKNIILEEENSIYFTPKTNINSTTNNYINTAKIINTKKKCFTISEDENYSDSSDDLNKSFNEFNTINNFSENIANDDYNNYNPNIIETDTEMCSEKYNLNNTDNSQSLNKNIFVKNI